MRGLRLRQRHLPQTSTKKYVRRKRLITFGQLLLQFTNKVLSTMLRQKFTGLVWASSVRASFQNPFFLVLSKVQCDRVGLDTVSFEDLLQSTREPSRHARMS
jgi:hypothetical protein